MISRASKVFDVLFIGAGSIGVPAALAACKQGLKVGVVEAGASPGQGDNKHAIGGVRATHMERAKILTGIRSLEIFSSWEEMTGDHIEWKTGGYIFPFWEDKEENILTPMVKTHHKYGLKSEIASKEKTMELVPGIAEEGLRGGLYTATDGSASPLLAVLSFYEHAKKAGAEFRFRTPVAKLLREGDKVTGVKLADGEELEAGTVVDCAGAFSPDLVEGLYPTPLPVLPELHEAGVTEAVAPFIDPMVVDMRYGDRSKNFYFYQNSLGQIIFCVTPEPGIFGHDLRETSIFLPQVAKRLLEVVPRLADARVRRQWRGIYPITPDGLPLVGWSPHLRNYFHMTGMAGQGFMLGPGLGDVAARVFTQQSTEDDALILDELSVGREIVDNEENPLK